MNLLTLFGRQHPRESAAVGFAVDLCVFPTLQGALWAEEGDVNECDVKKITLCPFIKSNKHN